MTKLVVMGVLTILVVAIGSIMLNVYCRPTIERTPFHGRFGTERTRHRSVNRWTTRARTSSHGSPVDSPFMTRRARRSIS